MFKSLLTAAACAAIVAPAVLAQADEVTPLAIGDKAPLLEHVEWIKGEPVSTFEEGEIYVLDFWATWCPPCVAAIPHINEVQAKYKDDNVNVIAVAVWPRDGMTPTDQYVQMRGDDMSYTVAEDMDMKTARAYMEAYGKETGWGGIPTIMIINKQGELAWVGRPDSEFDLALELMVSDEFSQERLAEESEKLRVAKQERDAKVSAVVQRAQQALIPGSEDWAAAEIALGELVELDKDYLMGVAPIVYVAKAKQGKMDEGRKYVADLMSTAFKSDPMSLNRMAWAIIGPESPLIGDELDSELAITIAEKAVEITEEKDADILDTLARAYYMDESYPLAVETQTKVVEMAPDNQMYKDNLERYKQAAAKG